MIFKYFYIIFELQETRLELVFLGHEPNRLTITAFLQIIIRL